MKLEYELFNKNSEIAVVIETALGSTLTEWIPIIKTLSDKFAVFLYNRAGYGESESANDLRTADEIAQQLHELITKYLPEKKYIFVGHSLGAIYAEKYVRDYPEKIIGLILLDPATTFEGLYKTELSFWEFKRSRIDKSATIKWGLWLGRLGLLTLLKPLFKKSVPFIYYSAYSENHRKKILNHMCRRQMYVSMNKEYNAFQNQTLLSSVLRKNILPQIPICIIYHSPDVVMLEMKKYANLSLELAAKIESIWLNTIVSHFSEIEGKYQLKIAKGASHYIHLTNPDILYQTIDEIANTSN